MEHTKAPWKVSEGTTKESFKDGDYFKNIYSSDGFACGRAYGETVDECIATAHLIAAAPELLDGCKAFIDFLGTDLTYTEIAAIKSEIRKLIAKADGK